MRHRDSTARSAVCCRSPHAGTHSRRTSVRRLAHRGPAFSRLGASGNSGATQFSYFTLPEQRRPSLECTSADQWRPAVKSDYSCYSNVRKNLRASTQRERSETARPVACRPFAGGKLIADSATLSGSLARPHPSAPGAPDTIRTCDLCRPRSRAKSS